MRIHGYLAFVFGICLTAWTCLAVVDAQDERLRAAFKRDADKIAAETGARLQTYFDTLLSLKGLFAGSDEVSRAEFARFVSEMDLGGRYPGFQAIQFVRRVPDAELAAFIQRVRADASVQPGGYRDFSVHPKDAVRDHYIIDYNEPMKGNEAAFGLDIATMPHHQRLTQIGRDTDNLVASEPIALAQDKSGKPGFVVRAPVYRNGLPHKTEEQRRVAFVGLVAMVFRVDNLMREVIDPQLLEQMAVRIHDGGEVAGGAPQAPSASNLLFERGGGMLASPAQTASMTVAVAQRRWVIDCTALAGSRYGRDLTSVTLIGLAGFVISALMATVLISLSRSKALAVQLRGTLEEQRAFQDSACVGIALFAHGVVQRCNRGMEEMLGYDEGALIGKPTHILSRRDTLADHDPFAFEAATRRWQGELELVRRDGRTIWCLVNGKGHVAEDLARGGVWVIQDISDRKRTEAALDDARDGLQHSLAELQEQKHNVEQARSDLAAVLDTLNQAQTNLITSEKMASLGALVAGVAHELNTPIGNSLLTASALNDLVADFEQQLETGIKRSVLQAHLQHTREGCAILMGSLRRAADLINSFKQVAVDQTSDKRRDFNLSSVLRDTLATFAAQLRRANCDTALEMVDEVQLDSYPGSVGQVVSNLINNALLHAFEGRAKAHIVITVSRIDDERVQIVFADDGVGMPPKVLRQIFNPFFTTKMGQGGSGLGMNIVYNIVTNVLGGTIEIDSAPGEGSTVTLRLPLSAPVRAGGDEDFDQLVA